MGAPMAWVGYPTQAVEGIDIAEVNAQRSRRITLAPRAQAECNASVRLAWEATDRRPKKTSSDDGIAMRTIVDLPDPERAQLDALCRERGLSRVEALQQALRAEWSGR